MIDGRGLVTPASFSKVLDDLGLQYGQPEVAKVLEYCVINVDGFVAYKDLIKKFAPGTPRAKQAETEQFVLKANDIAMEREATSAQMSANVMQNNVMPPPLHDVTHMREFLARQTEEIRRLYSRWDRGMLTDRAFVNALEQDLHIPLTDEFRHVMAVHGPSRNLSFAKLMTSLRIDNFLGKSSNRQAPTKMPEKIFTNLQDASSDMGAYDLRQYSEPIESGRQPQMGQIRRNPITWDSHTGLKVAELQKTEKLSPNRFNDIHMGQNLAADYVDPATLAEQTHNPYNYRATEDVRNLDRDRFLRSAIYHFCDGKYGSWVFRQQLAEAGVLITIELDRLIRQHESSNSAKVADFLSAISRNEKSYQVEARSPRYREEMSSKRSSEPGPMTSSLQTPYATELTMPQKQAVTYADASMVVPDIITWNKQPPRKPNKSLHPEHIANRSGGDIIAWRRDDSKEGANGANTNDAVAKPSARNYGNDDVMNIISWNGGEPLDIEAAHRTGKKCFRVAETGHHAPFGTDADRGKTAEECHTMEYRPQLHHDGGRMAYGY